MTNPDVPTDAHWMQLALAQAELARRAGEVPVGAVVVRHGKLVGAGHNTPIGSHDPTAHAEIAALRAAAQHLGNYRLDDCELFVTLEPCAMCAGAMLHARLRRVVYGAADPKAGTAGSVMDVFASKQLNHQTMVTGGVASEVCAELLQDFFRQQRRLQQHIRVQMGRALRDDAVRTPEQRFAALPEMPAAPHYVNELASLAGLRLHYVDSGPAVDAPVWLCLHGPRDWSLVWRAMLMTPSTTRARWICPDLIGFGKSDKPKKEAQHSLGWHAQVLFELIDHLNLQHLNLIAPHSMTELADVLMALAPERIQALSTVDQPELDAVAQRAPFPDRGHEAALRAFAVLCPQERQSTAPTTTLSS